MKILLTGGTRGVGLELLKKFKPSDQILVVSRNIKKVKGEFESNKNITFLSVDLSDASSYKKIVRYIKREWGRVDIIVNNAAVLSTTNVDVVTSNEISAVLNTNFMSPLLLTNSIAKYLAPNGLIVNILTPAVFRNRQTLWLYVASKRAFYASSEALLISKPVLMYFPGIINTGIVKGNKSILARIIERQPSYSANKIYNLIGKRRAGYYFEPVAKLIQIAGILGF